MQHVTMVSKLSDVDKLECVKLYNEGKSCKEIAQNYNVSTQAIWGILKRRNVKMRTQHEVQQKYNCDEHFFDVIDCESKAYFFGLLYADGCNLDSRNNITLSLQECDKHILDAMTQLIQPEKPLQFIKLNDKHPTWKNQYRIVICSKHMCDTLNNYGLVPRKSLIKTFPEVILHSNEEIQRHFIRGYFDGNGSHSYKSMDICSTYEFLQGLLDLLNIYCPVEYTIDKRHKNRDTNSYTLRLYKKENMLKVMNWLECKSNICILRKH